MLLRDDVNGATPRLPIGEKASTMVPHRMRTSDSRAGGVISAGLQEVRGAGCRGRGRGGLVAVEVYDSDGFCFDC